MTLNIKSPIEYFPLKIGNTELKKDKNLFTLYDANQHWMNYDTLTNFQASEFFIELELGYGKCVTTGLGLGIIQTLLAEKNTVNEVVVYEKNADVIEMFRIFTKESNIDTSKIVIINEDANNIKNITCDCLFLDHFERETPVEIIETVKRIASENTIDLVWFWPAYHFYVDYCISMNKEIDTTSFLEWSSNLNINKFPKQVTAQQLNVLVEFIDEVFVGQIKSKLLLIENRNKLIKMFKRKK
jgi:hypothetical protein